ncbi:Glycosyltransferase involved in cell wall bisynthesis [Lacrimispora sphenoides]|jgi:glycosyltransferase involved in cell wall biosynthesis|uniref:glycosyltransferase n=1 Tax=Lacrimispora sphenoides TaxID=29370 RepID=UPI0008B5F37C|nr:glycosyltransferase [Lacrimispora sphenoides]SET90609.1 Glycosyltransferase involved in cell wall bisynthesis [Lacrimispora sphenoides]
MNNNPRNKETPIKVLHIGADNIGRGGRSVIVFNLTQHMNPKLVCNDFLCFKKVEAELENLINDKGGHLQYILNLPKRNKRLTYEYARTKAILDTIKNNKYDIIHIHADHAYEVIKSAIISKMAGCRVVFAHAHATGISENSNRALPFIIGLCKKNIPLFCDRTFACSNEAAKFMFGRIPNDLVIINNGIELDSYTFNPELRKRIREGLHISDKYVIGCIGRLTEPKNHQFLIKVFYEYQKTDKNSILMLVGDGELRAEIEKLSQDFGIRDSVMFMGNCNNVKELLQGMDIFVLTSKREGFGIVNIEAQAAGLQCVVSDVVPKTAKVEDNFQFLSINEPAIIWANCIRNSKKINAKRESNIDLLKEKGYDIADNSIVLQEIYVNIMR